MVDVRLISGKRLASWSKYGRLMSSVWRVAKIILKKQKFSDQVAIKSVLHPDKYLKVKGKMIFLVIYIYVYIDLYITGMIQKFRDLA